ncbi:hypothetical protein [Caulifigura coniformis]|uniref:hypothetical protein n=1 Tax=Caulifigura coniformis TaxID=2527983 RepID=UPI00119EB3AD|nr:hypothetical protein [Caulifigura coniformis]
MLTLPDPEPEDDFALDLELAPSRAGRSLPAAKKKKKSKSRSAASGKPWYLGYWQWLVVLAVLLLAPIPRFGLAFAGFVAFAGVAMVLIGGIVPFLRIIFGDPGTVLAMLVSRSARFDMMRQPDSHPYKALVRNAFNPTRGLFWRGVLFVVTFVPAAFIYGIAGEFFRTRVNAAAAPLQVPHGLPPGVVRARQPEFQQQPDRPPFRPFEPPLSQRPPSRSSDPYQVEVVYQRFQGAGTPTEAVQQALKRIPELIDGTLEVDESAKTIRFQTQGGVNAAVIGPLLGRAGFGSLQVSAKPVSNN